MFDTLQTYAATAVQSDFFAGGLALGAMGLLAGSAHLGWGRLHAFCARKLCVTVEVDNRVNEFRHVLNWLEHAQAFRRVRRFRLTWTGGRNESRASFAPSVGRHWFVLDGQLVRLDRDLNERAKAGRSNAPLESLIFTLPFGTRKTVERWIKQGAELEAQTARIGPGLHIHVDNYWTHAGDVVRRPIETLVAEDDRLHTLCDDVRWFYGARDWYVARGIPWRRGYLLHGPPGTGKSSAIRAVASELGQNLAILDISRKTLGDDQLCEAMVEAPKDVILVFEDIDAAFRGRSKDTSDGISFSGLLNAIDGVAAQEGRTLFMTTNHIEKLDPALIRPGRADYRTELGLVGADAARAMFLRFFPGETLRADVFHEHLGDGRFSPAELQGWLLANAKDAKTAAGAEAFRRTLGLAAG